MDISPGQSCRSEQERVVLVPLLRPVARHVVAVHPEGEGKDTAALSATSPPISLAWIGTHPRLNVKAIVRHTETSWDSSQLLYDKLERQTYPVLSAATEGEGAHASERRTEGKDVGRIPRCTPVYVDPDPRSNRRSGNRPEDTTPWRVCRHFRCTSGWA